MRAALYSRVSSAEDEVTAKRHETAARKLARDRGWDAILYRDNDVSATSGVRRPEWERMLRDLASGAVEAVVAYSSARMYRRPKDLEPLIDLAKTHNIQIATVASGQINLDTADGRLVAGILAQVDQAESERIGERQKLKALENAQQGKPHGHRRPFGYRQENPGTQTLGRNDPNFVAPSGNYVIDEREAQAIRDAVAGILAGKSLGTICDELNEAGLATVTGRTWKPSGLSQTLRGPAIIGKRTHLDVLYDATWPAIISAEDQALTQRILASASKGHPDRGGARPRYLLSGLLHCAVCGATLHYAKAKNGSYSCAKSGGGAGCVRITSRKVEAYVWMACMERQPRHRKVSTLASEGSRNLVRKRLQFLERRDRLSARNALGELDGREYVVMRETIDNKLREITEELSKVPAPSTTNFPKRLMGSDLTVAERREYIASLTKSITVGKGRVTTERVRINWR